MSRIRPFVLVCAVVTVGALAGPAQAASAAPAPRVFANCTQMHTVYPGGVARPGAVDRGSTAHRHFKPHYDKARYLANAKSDRDHDGIACEA